MNGDQEIAFTVDLLMVSVDIPHNGSKCCACNGCSWVPMGVLGVTQGKNEIQKKERS